MMIAIVPVLVSIAGALLYALSSNAKLSEIGRIAFAAGMFALCYSLAAHTIRIG